MEENLKGSIKEKVKQKSNSKQTTSSKANAKTNSKPNAKTNSKGSSKVKAPEKTTQKSKTNIKDNSKTVKKVKEEIKDKKRTNSKPKQTTSSKAKVKTNSKSKIKEKQKESIKEEPIKKPKEVIKEDKKNNITSNQSNVKKILTKVFSLAVILFFITFIFYKSGSFNKLEIKYIKSGLSIQNINLDNGNLILELHQPAIKKDRWCQILSENDEISDLNWIKVINNTCVCDIQDNMKYIVIKDEKNLSPKIKIEDYLNAIISLNTEKERIIIVKGEEKELEVGIKYIGTPELTLSYISENEEILKTKDNVLEGVETGKTNLNISDRYNHTITIPVIVTDLVTTPQLNEKKAFLKAGQYTEEEAHIIDEILEERVKEAGLKTRAGVVAAARFVTLEFKYRVPYFLENGRFQKTGFSEQIDGEGRYYHKGLYLTKDKFEIIKRSKRKPAVWGATLYEYSNSRYMKNGLDCSGFVSWALLNGGYDPGDIGAGPNASFITLPDLGVSQPITLNLLKSGKVKAGDLIGWNGHIGIIIGIDDEYIYTADTVYYQKGLVATKYTLEKMANKSLFTHIYDMSEYYVDDGNYTNMW